MALRRGREAGNRRRVSLVEIRSKIARARAESAAEVLLESGWAEWSVWEDALSQEAWLVGFFEDESAARSSWRKLQLRIGPTGAARVRAVADQEWRDSYKAHFKPWRYRGLHWVPEWERASHRVPRGEVAVWLDPGLAFGTGNHETTRLCVEALVRTAKELSAARRRRARVIDAGCGSGILGISAAKLGFGEVFAFDNDAVAVANARKNVRRNRCGGVVQVARGGLDQRLEQRSADVVLANIQADVLMAHAQRLLGAVRAGGTLVLSGILARELAPVRQCFRALAGKEAMVRAPTRGEWVALVWTKTKRRLHAQPP